MKKIALILIAVLLVLFAGCGKEPASENREWDRNAKEHWQYDENGEKINVGEHEFDDQNNCAVCKSGFVDLGDGCAYMVDYDEEFRMLRETYFNADGEIDKDVTYEYGFDEEGNMISLLTYVNGEISVEGEFEMAAGGYPILVKEKVYTEEGSTVSTFNEYACTGNAFYDKNGALLSESVHEISEDKDGYIYISRETVTDYEKNTKSETGYNEHIDVTYVYGYELRNGEEVLVYTEVNEYDYENEGAMTYHSVSVDGRLCNEYFYDWYEEGGTHLSFCSKEIVYNEDGSYVVYEYNVNSEVINKTAFDENGNEIG